MYDVRTFIVGLSVKQCISKQTCSTVQTVLSVSYNITNSIIISEVRCANV